MLLILSGCDIITVPAGDPTVTSVTPAEGTQNVSVGASVKLELKLPAGGVNIPSANDNSVTLTDVASGQQVAASVQVDNDSERLVLKPNVPLAYATQYSFVLTGEVEDERGNAFAEYSSLFTTVAADVPSVTGTTPYDGETGVSVYDTAAINSSGINGVNGGVDPATLSSNTVYLTNLTTGARVPGTASTSGGGDTITFGLAEPLAEGTEYQFDVTSGVRSLEGAVPFTPYTSTFITSGAGGENPSQPSNAVLTFQPSTDDVRHSSLVVLGTYLYASTIDGRILRYPVADDGSLGAAEQLTALTEPDGKARLTVGFAFDPTATPENPVAWVSSVGFTGFDGTGGIQNGNTEYRWSGKITRLSGPNLSTQQDVVVGLPRSSKDHVTNSIAFNPAEPGVLYFNQGSNTAMGAPDTLWRFQPERVLSGAVLRLNYQAVGSGTLNVKTEDGGTYDPYADGAPLTVYASGVRNAYDLVWHSNGHLYVPANGSAENGTMPSYDPLPGTCENRPDGSYTGTTLVGRDALSNLRYITSGTDPEGATVPVNGWTIPQTMNDYLFDVEAGGYYGSPNPKRCEWILYGGGVGTGNGDDKIDTFPSSVEPDPNYRGFAFNFGQNISPNGAIEYKGNAFSQFKGKLLVARYASGDNIVALGFDGNGNVSGEVQPVVGINSFADPIDLTEDPRTGFLYVSSYDQTEKNPLPTGITLVRPR